MPNRLATCLTIAGLVFSPGTLAATSHGRMNLPDAALTPLAYDMPETYGEITYRNFPNFPEVVDLFTTGRTLAAAQRLRQNPLAHIIPDGCGPGCTSLDAIEDYVEGGRQRSHLAYVHLFDHLPLAANVIFNIMENNPFGFECDGGYVEGYPETCDEAYARQRINRASVPLRYRHTAGRKLWSDLFVRNGAAFAFQRARSADDRRVLAELLRLAATPHPFDCADIDDGRLTFIDACGVFRWGRLRGADFIVYCLRTNVPEQGVLIRFCIPMARMRRGHWELAQLVALGSDATGGGSWWMCDFSGISSPHALAQHVSNALGLALVDRPLSVRQRGHSSFVMGGQQLNVDLRRWSGGMSGWGAIQFAGGIVLDGQGGAHMTFMIDVLASPRRMASRTDAREMQAEAAERFFATALRRMNARLGDLAPRTFRSGSCRLEMV